MYLWIKLGASFLAMSVILGAFGSHGLNDVLMKYGTIEIFKTAVLYQMIHGMALFVVAWLMSLKPSPKLTFSAILFSVGIIFFSGSLYVLSISDILWVGYLTPVGGICFILGWFLMVIG